MSFLKPGRIVWVASSHPLFAEFGEKTVDYLKTTRFSACFPVRDVTGDILMRIDNGYPVLLEKRINRGRIFFFPFNVQEQWTNFHKKPFFPVMMSLLIEHLSGYTPSIYVGDNVVVKGTENVSTVSVINPAGERTVIRNNEKKVFSYVPDIPGIWTVIFSDREGEQKQTIAANIPYEEGDLSKISSGEIRSVLRKKHIRFAKNDRMEKLVLAETTGGQLMMVFLYLAFGLLIGELMLSNILVFLKKRTARNVQY